MSSIALVVALVAAGEWVDLTWDTALVKARDQVEYRALVENALDSAVSHATQTLQVRLSAAVKAHVYTRLNFRVRFGEATAARYAAYYRAGMIHVNGGSEIDAAFVALVGHEMVHAVLDHRGRGGHFPGWLNEGLAERVRYQMLQSQTGMGDKAAELRGVLRNRQLGPLPQGRGLSSAEYFISWAAVDYLVAAHGERALLEIVRRVIAGEAFDRVFSSATGVSAALFEERFRESVGALPVQRVRPRFR